VVERRGVELGLLLVPLELLVEVSGSFRPGLHSLPLPHQQMLFTFHSVFLHLSSLCSLIQNLCLSPLVILRNPISSSSQTLYASATNFALPSVAVLLVLSFVLLLFLKLSIPHLNSLYFYDPHSVFCSTIYLCNVLLPASNLIFG
jgi:hypothetical protein